MIERTILGVCVLAGVAGLTGCGSGGRTSPDARSDVMDLNDSPRVSAPAAPTPPTVEAPPPLPLPPAAPAVRKHVITAKDTFYSLARQYYGDARQWPRIQAANPDIVPERMPIGKTIVIPE